MNVKCANQANSPLLVRRGGCAVMKDVAKHPCSAQTGWSNMTQTRSPEIMVNRPFRPLHQRWLRTIFPDVAFTPPHEGCCSTRHTVARPSFWTVEAVYDRAY